MLWTIAVLLLILWLLGMVSSYTLGGFIHILLVLAIITILIRVIQGRSPVVWVAGESSPNTKDPLTLTWSAWFKDWNPLEEIMNKDRVEGKAKDVAGRVERQVGEWTGDSEAEVKGAAKQAEGKVQNAFGKAKDAVKDADDKAASNERRDQAVEDEESGTPRRRAS
jgi:uncharacterized protein YjbJ (UPF0337 family)